MYNRALRLMRVYHDLSQAELAKRLDLSKSYISELEGERKPSMEVLQKYADYFKIPLSSLMLFAEQAESGGITEKARAGAADKVLKMLDWIATIADTKEGD